MLQIICMESNNERMAFLCVTGTHIKLKFYKNTYTNNLKGISVSNKVGKKIYS